MSKDPFAPAAPARPGHQPLAGFAIVVRKAASGQGLARLELASAGKSISVQSGVGGEILTTDPMDQFWNPYSYVGGSPLIGWDPSGLEDNGGTITQSNTTTGDRTIVGGEIDVTGHIDPTITGPSLDLGEMRIGANSSSGNELPNFSLDFNGGKYSSLTLDRRLSDGNLYRYSFPVFSGQGQKRNVSRYSGDEMGPIPSGRYYIVQREHGGMRDAFMSMFRRDKNIWFSLYADDGTIDDKTFIGNVPRGAFRLHPGTISHGCVTLPNVNNFTMIRQLLLSNTPVKIPGTELMYYGILTVGGANASR